MNLLLLNGEPTVLQSPSGLYVEDSVVNMTNIPNNRIWYEQMLQDFTSSLLVY